MKGRIIPRHYIVRTLRKEKEVSDLEQTIKAMDNALMFLEAMGYTGGDIHDDLADAIESLVSRHVCARCGNATANRVLCDICGLEVIAYANHPTGRSK